MVLWILTLTVENYGTMGKETMVLGSKLWYYNYIKFYSIVFLEHPIFSTFHDILIQEIRF